MLVKTYNQKGEEVGKAQLPKTVFDVKVNPDLIYQVVTSQLSNQRQNIAHTKGRGEVSGGGRKPWKQKGTGRARHGSNRSPIWRHGGVAFGPTNEKNFARKINKKMKKLAMFMVLSVKAKNNLLYVLDDLEVKEPKTRLLADTVKNLRDKIEGLKKGTIIIAMPKYDRMLVLAAKNLKGVKTIEAAKLNSLELLSAKFLVLPKDSIGTIKETFQKAEEEEEVEKE
jgi:large subunit ribosomal protein L4